MHLRLDDEIYRLENRIASRKGQLTYVSRATGRRARRRSRIQPLLRIIRLST